MYNRLITKFFAIDFTISALITAWGIAGFSIYIDKTTGSDWFGRSGSLIVLFAVMSEYLLLKAKNEHIYNLIVKGRWNAENSLRPTGVLAPDKTHLIKEKAAHVSVVLGTLIWGYGDLLLKL